MSRPLVPARAEPRASRCRRPRPSRRRGSAPRRGCPERECRRLPPIVPLWRSRSPVPRGRYRAEIYVAEVEQHRPEVDVRPADLARDRARRASSARLRRGPPTVARSRPTVRASPSRVVISAATRGASRADRARRARSPGLRCDRRPDRRPASISSARPRDVRVVGRGPVDRARARASIHAAAPPAVAVLPEPESRDRSRPRASAVAPASSRQPSNACRSSGASRVAR